MLIYRAYFRLSATPDVNSWIFAGSGLLLALLIHHFGFLKIVNRNLKRIQKMEEKVYITSFIHKKSYLIILVMIAMGFLLRRSGIPKQYLASVTVYRNRHGFDTVQHEILKDLCFRKKPEARLMNPHEPAGKCMALKMYS